MKKERGFTLIHCLLLMVLTMILGTTTFRMTAHGTRHTVLSHWGRTAEALADGALELALSELESGGEEMNLDATLSTGVASARIVRGTGEIPHRIVFQGTVAPEGRVLAGRTYEATVLEDSEGRYQVVSVRRL